MLACVRLSAPSPIPPPGAYHCAPPNIVCADTPQQLAGSLRYGSGVLLGNWREDDELDAMRMANYIEAKEGMSLTLLKKQGRLAPQLVPVQLTAPPPDGLMRFGDEVLLKSLHNEGTLAVSMGQKLVFHDEDLYATFATPKPEAMARNVITFTR